MSRLFVVLTLVMLLFNAAGTQTKRESPEWSLFLKTFGAPWDKKFEVTLNHTGALSVTSDDPAKMPATITSKVDVKLSTNDVREIYEQALTAFREFQLRKEEEEHADGTNLTLTLTANRRTLSMQVSHLATVEDEIPEVGKLLALLNKHLPKEHQVY
jgi:hypothetical protein